MSTEIPAAVLEAAEKVRSLGGFPLLVATTDKDLPFVVFSRPNIEQLSQYVAKASDASVGPLLAAIGLSRISAKYPDASVLSGVELVRPFAIMRAVQALLADLGLSVKAQKKSL